MLKELIPVLRELKLESTPLSILKIRLLICLKSTASIFSHDMAHWTLILSLT
jgi:hypothetical protein